MAEQKSTRWAVRLAWTTFVLAILCAIAAALAGYGRQWEMWDHRMGFTIFRSTAYTAAGVGFVALIASIWTLVTAQRRAAIAALAAVAITAAIVVPAWDLQQTAEMVPRIHDITTDTDDPPVWVALREVREKAPNGAKYGGAKIAEQQKASFPDIQPMKSADPPAQLFERALAAAKGMGWEIIAAEPGEGRIEATATTKWFKFKDDVVIRIRAQDGGSRLDIRSMSRLGRSDLGTNARRIREYLKKL